MPLPGIIIRRRRSVSKIDTEMDQEVTKMETNVEKMAKVETNTKVAKVETEMETKVETEMETKVAEVEMETKVEKQVTKADHGEMITMKTMENLLRFHGR
jgi:hypothetical protein